MNEPCRQSLRRVRAHSRGNGHLFNFTEEQISERAARLGQEAKAYHLHGQQEIWEVAIATLKEDALRREGQM